MAASIRSLRNGGTPIVGASRDDLQLGDVVKVESVNTHTTYSWTLLFKPAGSTAAFSGSVVAPTPGTFTVDKEGPYLIRLTADLGLPTESTQIVRLRWLTRFADLKLVAAGEGYGGAVPVPVDIGTTGWADQQNYNLQALLGYIATVSASGRLLYVDSNAGTEGYADHSTIQAAISAAMADGAGVTTPYVVLVRPGLYVENLTLAPFVHLIGWPGNPSGTDNQRVVVVRGVHSANLTNASDVAILSAITFETILAGTAATILKDGPGKLIAYRCNLEQNGLSPTQGPALRVREGGVLLDGCEIVATSALAADRSAIVSTGQSASTLEVRRSLVRGPTGISLNTQGNPGVQAEIVDSRVVSTGGFGAAGILSDAESLLLEYSRVQAASGDALLVHPGAGALAADVGVTVRWSYIGGPISFDTTGIAGSTSLLVGSSEYSSFVFPGGTPGTLSATTKSTSLFYDNTASGLSATNVQDAIDEVMTLVGLVKTLDDAYDGGVPNSGSGRTIVADQGAVQIVDAPFPSDPPPPGNTSGRLQVVGGVEVGSIGEPEIDVDPNPYGTGPAILMGNRVVPNNNPFGAGTATVMARSTGSPLFRNYNLRVQTESSSGGGAIGRLIIQGGDAYDNGVVTPDAGSIYIQAGSAFDPTAEPGDVFIAPGRRQGGAPGSIVLVRPGSSTPATLTASGPAISPLGVAGSVTFATNMGAVTATFLATDNLATVVAKLNALDGISASQSAGIITLTTDHEGPNAEIYFLSADPGVDVALGGFDGVPQVDGTYGETIRIRVTDQNEISFGVGGSTGPMIYNADTGKLTVPGVIDPTALILTWAPPPATGSNEAALFVADGSSGTIAGELYYREQSIGTVIPLSPGNVRVSDEGSDLGRFTTLDFTGPGVSVTDAGGGVATVNVVGGVSGISVEDEGVPLGSFTTLNFVGADIRAFDVGGVATIYVPPPAFDSHWNTSDGTNGNQAVTESISRTTTHISTPTSEGVPFATGGWADTNQPTTTTGSVTFTTPSTTTGFGGDSTMTVTVFDADGTSVLETFTTAPITGNGTQSAGNISIVITSFGPDAFRFKAKATVVVNVAAILTGLGREGGRYHVLVRHTTDSATDGTGPYDYIQPDVFLDANPTTPSINGTVTIAERAGFIVTKHLSGIEYYTTGSQFTVTVNDIDQLNRDTARTSDNLRLTGTEYGLPLLQHSPFGTGSTNFTGWTNNYNQDNVTYQRLDWAINATSFRYIGPTGNVSVFPRDPWANGTTVDSTDAAILIDTFGTTSTDLIENFDDEARRQDSTYNGGSSSGNWISANTLAAGHALVFGGQMMVPNQSTYIRSDGPNTANADWTAFKPDIGGANPDYSALGAPVSHYRTIVDTSGLNRASFQIVFTGTFVADATTDLANQDLQIFIRRRASANGGNTGTAAPPLLLHGSLYNFATFDDGVTDGHIREASSSGNIVNGTFGGFTCETGFFIEVRIVNPNIKIDRYEVIFF